MHARAAHLLPDDRPLFIEVIVTDSSDFEDELLVTGEDRFGMSVLTVRASSVPNAIAAVLLHLHRELGCAPHVYFRWTEGRPFANLMRFLLFGEGEIAAVTREVLREAEPNPQGRPWVHVA